MLRAFFSGVYAYRQAWGFLQRSKRWGLLLFPAMLCLLVVATLLGLAIYWGPQLSEAVWSFIAPEGGFTGEGVAQLMLKVTITAFMLLLLYFSYKLLVINLMAPILIFISDVVLTELYGKEQAPPFVWKVFVKLALQGLWESLRLLFWELLMVVTVLLLMLLIPLLSPLGPVVLLLIEAYFVGVAMVDFTSGYFGYEIQRMRTFRRRFRHFSMGVGLVFSLMLLIPLIGVLFAPPLAAIAAAVGIHHQLNHSTSKR